jgi:glycosyltransferase involved in cell wall biosynthesis
MNIPILSICIATYNRSGYIGETLDSIIPQLSDDVELLVVDGASTDSTDAVVRSYMNHEPRIRYVRLNEKGGVDQDYCKAVEFARGVYCWLFTDDDVLKPGAVDVVKTAISEGHDLIVVNAEVRDRGLNKLLSPRQIIMSCNKSYAPEDIDRLCNDALKYLTFIGAVVIRRNVWLSREKELYFGTEFVHVGVIFQKLLNKTALIIVKPYICIRYGNGQWKPRSFEIWMFKWPKLVWSFETISDAVKQNVTPKEPWKKLSTLLLLRGKGAYNIQHFCDFFSDLQLSKSWKICAKIISLLPIKILSSVLHCYSRLVIKDLIQLADLELDK